MDAVGNHFWHCAEPYEGHVELLKVQVPSLEEIVYNNHFVLLHFLYCSGVSITLGVGGLIK